MNYAVIAKSIANASHSSGRDSNVMELCVGILVLIICINIIYKFVIWLYPKVFKKKLSEAAAALLFVLKVNKWVLENDAAIKSSIQEMLGDKYPLSNFKGYYDELNYATLALLMPTIKNLFDESQAQRIENKVYEAVSIVGDVSLLQIYLNAEKEYYDPLNAIPYKLLKRWIGEDIELDAVDEMLICIQINCCLLPIRGCWQYIQNTYRIVESDEKVEQLIKPVN